MRVLMIVLANAALTLTVTKTPIFAPLRDFWNSRKNPFFGKLLSCPYCFSHWGSLLLVSWMYYGEYSVRYFPFYWLGVVTLTAPVILALGWTLQTLAGLEGEEAE